MSGACSNVWKRLTTKKTKLTKKSKFPFQAPIGSKEARDWFQGGLMSRFKEWVNIPGYVAWMSTPEGLKDLIKLYGPYTKNVIGNFLDAVLYFTSNTSPLSGFSELQIPAVVNSTSSFVDMSATDDIYFNVPYLKKQGNNTVDDIVFEVFINATPSTRTDKFINLEFRFPSNKFNVDPIPDTTTPTIKVNTASHLNQLLQSLTQNLLLTVTERKKIVTGLMDTYILPKCKEAANPSSFSFSGDYSQSMLYQISRELVNPAIEVQDLAQPDLTYSKISLNNKNIGLVPFKAKDGKVEKWLYTCSLKGVRYNPTLDQPTGGFTTTTDEAASDYIELYGDYIEFSCDDNEMGGYLKIHQRTVMIKRKNKEQVDFPIFIETVARSMGMTLPVTWAQLSSQSINKNTSIPYQTMVAAWLKRTIREDPFTKVEETVVDPITNANQQVQVSYAKIPLFESTATTTNSAPDRLNCSLADLVNYFWKGQSKIVSTGEKGLLSIEGNTLTLEERKACTVYSNRTGFNDDLSSDSDDDYKNSSTLPKDTFTRGFSVNISFMEVNNGGNFSSSRGVVERVTGRALGVTFLTNANTTITQDYEAKRYTIPNQYYPSSNSSVSPLPTFSVSRTTDNSAQKVLSAHPQAQEMTQQTRTAGGARVSFANHVKYPPAPSSSSSSSSSS